MTVEQHRCPRSCQVSMFDPSEQQLAALANMERYAGIGSHRSHFVSAAAFQEYWDRLSQRCDRLTRQRQRQPDPTQRRQRQRERRQRHYGDEATLQAWAERYRQRYQPSVAKLRQRLLAKCDEAALVERVLAACLPNMDDEALAHHQGEELRDQGRSRPEIARRLRRRLFEPATIERALGALEGPDGSLWEPEFLDRQVQRLQARGCSSQAIRQRLATRPVDRAAVEAALERCCGAADEEANLRRALAPLLRKNLDEAAILRRLARRGFRYGDIRRQLTNGS